MIAQPAQVIPALAAVPLYELLIVPCLVLAFPAIAPQLAPESLARRSITACVLGTLALAVLSELAHGLFSFKSAGFELGKMVLYYLLVPAFLDTPARLRRFLAAFAGLTVLIVVPTLLVWYGYASIPGIGFLVEGSGPGAVRRLAVFGVFGGDPNDTSLLLALALGICIAGLSAPRGRLARLLWLGPTALFLLAMLLTRSRGGLLALMAVLATYFLDRYGWRRSLPYLVGALILASQLVSDRQSDITLDQGTAQSRIQLWSGAIVAVREHPLVGIGPGRFVPTFGLVAHNSFLHAYAELGFLGGACFVGAFYAAFRTLLQLRRGGAGGRDLQAIRLCLLAMLSGYGTGLLSLSRCYTVPTYLVLGLVTAYVGATRPVPPPPAQRLDPGRILAVGALTLAAFYVFVKIFVRWG
jgi:O-antigen ligase